MSGSEEAVGRIEPGALDGLDKFGGSGDGRETVVDQIPDVWMRVTYVSHCTPLPVLNFPGLWLMDGILMEFQTAFCQKYYYVDSLRLTLKIFHDRWY